MTGVRREYDGSTTGDLRKALLCVKGGFRKETGETGETFPNLRNFQTYSKSHLFTSFTSNYSFFTLLTLPLWLSTPPYPHLPLFYPPSRLDGSLDGSPTGLRRVRRVDSHSRPTVPVVLLPLFKGLSALLMAPKGRGMLNGGTTGVRRE